MSYNALFYGLSLLGSVVLIAAQHQFLIDTATFGAGALVAFAAVIVYGWLRDKRRKHSRA